MRIFENYSHEGHMYMHVHTQTVLSYGHVEVYFFPADKSQELANLMKKSNH